MLKESAKKNNPAATLQLELAGDYHRRARRLREETQRLISASHNQYIGFDVIALISRKMQD